MQEYYDFVLANQGKCFLWFYLGWSKKTMTENCSLVEMLQSVNIFVVSEPNFWQKKIKDCLRKKKLPEFLLSKPYFTESMEKFY